MASVCVSDNTTVRQSPAPGVEWTHRDFVGVNDATDEANVPCWWAPRGPGYVTRQDLLMSAQRRIADLMNVHPDWGDEAGLPVSPSAARMAMEVLLRLIAADNRPTPQISPTGDGGLDIEWLVSGKHLSLSVAPDGNIILWATRHDGAEVFSFDSTEDPAYLARYALKEADNFLSEISGSIRKRVAI